MSSLGLGRDTFDSRIFSSHVPMAIVAKHAVKRTLHPAQEHDSTRAGNRRMGSKAPRWNGGTFDPIRFLISGADAMGRRIPGQPSSMSPCHDINRHKPTHYLDKILHSQWGQRCQTHMSARGVMRCGYAPPGGPVCPPRVCAPGRPRCVCRGRRGCYPMPPPEGARACRPTGGRGGGELPIHLKITLSRRARNFPTCCNVCHPAYH